MLVHDVEIIDSEKLNIIRKKSKKTQIFLYDTQRRADDFINKIKQKTMEKTKEISKYLNYRNKLIILENVRRFKTVKEALTVFGIPKTYN